MRYLPHWKMDHFNQSWHLFFFFFLPHISDFLKKGKLCLLGWHYVTPVQHRSTCFLHYLHSRQCTLTFTLIRLVMRNLCFKISDCLSSHGQSFENRRNFWLRSWRNEALKWAFLQECGVSATRVLHKVCTETRTEVEACGAAWCGMQCVEFYSQDLVLYTPLQIKLRNTDLYVSSSICRCELMVIR